MQIDDLIEVTLDSPDNFLLLRETLQRIGVASHRDGKNILIQSAHILHKRGKYYIVMFKELFALDGRQTTITEDDIKRRNCIAKLVEQWGLCTIVHPERCADASGMESIKIVPHAERKNGNWLLEAKYSLGR